MWQTYTPDYQVFVLRRTDDGWLATCLRRTRAESQRAEAAIREAIGVSNPSGDEELEAWIAQHLAALETEGD